MDQISQRVANMAESETLAMARLSRELKAQGHDVISLSLGEPDFDTPEFVKEAAKKAIDDNNTHYPPVNGFLELRQAISNKFKRDNGLTYSPEQIVVSTGAKQSLMNVVLSLVNPGDEVILPAPYWVSYSAMAEFAEGKVVELPSSVETDYKISAEALAKAITPKTRLIMFSSPCNPSGSVYTKEELKAMADVIEQNPHVMVIADEIYELINFGGKHESLAQFESIYDQVITVNGVSKGFAMTGWRIGYIGAPKWVADACNKIQGQFTSGASTISQVAAMAAIDAEPSTMDYMKEAFLKRRDLLLAELKTIDGFISHVPQGAFYVFPDVSAWIGKKHEGGEITNAGDLCMFLLHEAKVAMVPGDAFGTPGCLRISYATSEEQLKEAVRRIKAALTKLS